MEWLIFGQAPPVAPHPWWMDEVVATLIGTFVATAIASVVAWLVAARTDWAEQRRSLIEQILKIIDIGMEYPFLEDDSLCDQWPKLDLPLDNRLRYDNYCCLVFNVMESIWTYCGGNRKKIRMILHVDELIWRHRCWWENDPENDKGYPIGFRKFVEAVIRERRNKEKANVSKGDSN